MDDPDLARAGFFASLGDRARPLVPARIRGTMRVDVSLPDGGVEHWYLKMADRGIRVSREDRPADTVLSITAERLDDLIKGRTLQISAGTRGDFALSGSTLVFDILSRFFSSAPGSRDPRITAQAHALHGREWRDRLDAHLARAKENRHGAANQHAGR